SDTSVRAGVGRLATGRDRCKHGPGDCCPPAGDADDPRRLRASGRDGGGVMNRPPSPLIMLLSRHTRRREFIAGLGGAAAWPLAARAQQDGRVRRVGALIGGDESDADRQATVAVFRTALQDLGWTEGRNLRIDWRWAANDANRARTYAAELVALNPDLLFGDNSFVVRELQQATRTLPIIFARTTEPVRAG